MKIKIEYLGVCAIIDANTETITITENHTNSEKLLNMIFKAMLNKININTNGYKIVREC